MFTDRRGNDYAQVLKEERELAILVIVVEGYLHILMRCEDISLAAEI